MKMKKLLIAASAAVIFGLASSTSAFALVLDFRDANAAGTGNISPLGGGNWQGVGIGMDQLAVFNGALTLYDLDGAVACAPCGGTTAASLDFNTLTGTFSITGSVPSLGVGNTVLLDGTISSFTAGPGGASGTTEINFRGSDTKDPELLIALGIDPELPFNFGGFTINMTADGTPISVDIPNSAVPEPGTVLLMGTGLAGLGLLRWRKSQA